MGRIGKHHSAETRLKISKSMIGKPHFSIRGENHYLWKGGATSGAKDIRRSFEYMIWRRKVFERDNYMCIWCGKRGDLNADHIKPFALFPKFRLIISNGRTLCIKCHKKTDNYAGKGITKIKKYGETSTTKVPEVPASDAVPQQGSLV